MPFVQAKCPECGGMLAVDDSNKAANCQFCGEAFIVQEAINHYNTYNITNNNTNRLYHTWIYAFGYVAPEFTTEDEYNGIGTIVVSNNYYEGDSYCVT